MTEKRIITEINCTTHEVVEREMTAAEIDNLNQMSAEYAAREEAEQAEKIRISNLKESARAKLVAGEALTEEEAAVIVL